MRFRWKELEIREQPSQHDYMDRGKLIATKKILQYNEGKWFSNWEDVYTINDTMYIDKKDIKNAEV